MKKNLEEETLYQDPSRKEFLKTQIFEDGTSRIVTVRKGKCELVEKCDREQRTNIHCVAEAQKFLVLHD